METFTTYQIAQMLGVDITTVIDWIDAGKIAAFKTPGGHRRVNPSDLLSFLQTYKMPIPDVLNVAAGRSSAKESKAGALPLQIQKKILIVDDDEGILAFIPRAIKKFYKNVKLELASDGFMAGKKIAEFKPDLLILDIRMPGMDGFEVLKYLDKSEKNMKIIAITAYPSKEILERIIKAGADDYLIKPFTAEQLKQKMTLLLKSIRRGGSP